MHGHACSNKQIVKTAKAPCTCSSTNARMWRQTRALANTAGREISRCPGKIWERKKSFHNITILVGRVASLLELLRVNWNKVLNSLTYVSWCWKDVSSIKKTPLTVLWYYRKDVSSTVKLLLQTEKLEGLGGNSKGFSFKNTGGETATIYEKPANVLPLSSARKLSVVFSVHQH